MFCVSIIGMFVYKEVTSNDTIMSLSSKWAFLMSLVVEGGKIPGVAIFISSINFKNVSYLLRLDNEEPIYETIGRKGTPGLCIFGWP